LPKASFPVDPKDITLDYSIANIERLKILSQLDRSRVLLSIGQVFIF